MSTELRLLLESVRRAAIMLVNACDDALGKPRTIPARKNRRGEGLTNQV